MAAQLPTASHWQSPRPAEDRAEHLANWLVIYLAALVACLAVVGGAWMVGLGR